MLRPRSGAFRFRVLINTVNPDGPNNPFWYPGYQSVKTSLITLVRKLKISGNDLRLLSNFSSNFELDRQLEKWSKLIFYSTNFGPNFGTQGTNWVESVKEKNLPLIAFSFPPIQTRAPEQWVLASDEFSLFLFSLFFYFLFF